MTSNRNTKLEIEVRERVKLPGFHYIESRRGKKVTAATPFRMPDNIAVICYAPKDNTM